MRSILWVSLDEYQRCTAEDRARWNLGIDLTRGGDIKRLNEHVQQDYEEEAEAWGTSVTNLIRGRP